MGQWVGGVLCCMATPRRGGHSGPPAPVGHTPRHHRKDQPADHEDAHREERREVRARPRPPPPLRLSTHPHGPIMDSQLVTSRRPNYFI